MIFENFRSRRKRSLVERMIDQREELTERIQKKLKLIMATLADVQVEVTRAVDLDKQVIALLDNGTPNDADILVMRDQLRDSNDLVAAAVLKAQTPPTDPATTARRR